MGGKLVSEGGTPELHKEFVFCLLGGVTEGVNILARLAGVTQQEWMRLELK